VAQASRPVALTVRTSSATASMSRSLGARQAAPMQKRLAPASLAAKAALRTVSTPINLLACTPVSKCTDCGQ